MSKTPTFAWVRPNGCDANACVEVRFCPHPAGPDDPRGGVLVRSGGVSISYDRREWVAFVEAVKRGEYDWPDAG